MRPHPPAVLVVAALSGFALAAAALSGCRGAPTSPSSERLLALPTRGMVEVEGGRVWYEVRGTGLRTPLLVLHGGPGIPHDYLANLADLGDERPVVFYDQLGCGRSDRPDDVSLWTRERFCRELDQVRRALHLDDVILYGHSWGTILAVDYLRGKGGAVPSGVKGAILAGPALSTTRWAEDAARMIEQLPTEAAAALREGERTGDLQSEAYQSALHLYYAEHVCRCDPWPQEVNDALATMGEQVYLTMAGPNEFTMTGTLAGLDLVPQLASLDLPVLYVCGEHDEATPDATRAYAAATPGAECVVIGGASHLCNWDGAREHHAVVRSWLDAHD